LQILRASRSADVAKIAAISGKHGSQSERMPGMQKALGRFSPYLFVALRIIAGLAFAQHGAQKLFGLLGARQAVPLISQMGMAGVIEFVGGILIALGLFTSPVAFVASGEMAWAYFQQHFPRGFWPIQNGGELAVLYCFIFLYFTVVGSGKLSIDAIRK
jgi:putative oxidoreductase